MKTCYGEGDLELFGGKLNLQVDGWKAMPVLSLREAARLLNPLNEFQGGSCKCKSGCKNRQCACKQKGATCSTKCHGGTSCSNCPQSDPTETNTSKSPSTKGKKRSRRGCSERDTSTKSPPPKKLKRPGSKQDPVEVSSTADSPKAKVNSWLPGLHLNRKDKEELQGGERLTDKHIRAAQQLV